MTCLSSHQHQERDEHNVIRTRSTGEEGSDTELGDEHEQIGEDIDQPNFMRTYIELILEKNNLSMNGTWTSVIHDQPYLDCSKALVKRINRQEIEKVQTQCETEGWFL